MEIFFGAYLGSPGEIRGILCVVVSCGFDVEGQ